MCSEERFRDLPGTGAAFALLLTAAIAAVAMIAGAWPVLQRSGLSALTVPTVDRRQHVGAQVAELDLPEQVLPQGRQIWRHIL